MGSWLWHVQNDVDTKLFIAGLPWWLSSKESACQCRRRGFDPWVGKMPLRRKWQSPPVVLPGKPQGQEKPGGLLLTQRVRQDLTTENKFIATFFFTVAKGSQIGQQEVSSEPSTAGVKSKMLQVHHEVLQKEVPTSTSCFLAP